MPAIEIPALVRVDAATFGYGAKAVVRVDELVLRRGQCFGLFGPNGSGKTTLVRGLAGLLLPLSGAVVACRPASGRAGEFVLPSVRFGYLPQYRGIDLSWPMSGFDAAAIAISAARPWGRIGHDDRKRVHSAMERLDVQDLSCRAFGTLSGGQQQRLLLAGAMAAEPEVLVLDEPTDGLDVRSRSNLLDLLRELTANGLCTAIISHDVEDLLAVCNEVGWLHAADVPGEPSRLELISPRGLAERILGARQSG